MVATPSTPGICQSTRQAGRAAPRRRPQAPGPPPRRPPRPPAGRPGEGIRRGDGERWHCRPPPGPGGRRIGRGAGPGRRRPGGGPDRRSWNTAVKWKVLPCPGVLSAQIRPHQVDEMAADRQSQPGAAIAARGRGIGLVEGLEQPGDLLRRHADALVGDGKWELMRPASTARVSTATTTDPAVENFTALAARLMSTCPRRRGRRSADSCRRRCRRSFDPRFSARNASTRTIARRPPRA